MTIVFEGSPTFVGISCDYARVTALNDLVLIRAVDTAFEDAVTISMRPDQARALAIGILHAAEKAEAGE